MRVIYRCFGGLGSTDRCHLQCGAGCIYCAQKEVLRLFRIGPEEIYRANIIYHYRMGSRLLAYDGKILTVKLLHTI